jgi:hypothetical protein
LPDKASILSKHVPVGECDQIRSRSAAQARESEGRVVEALYTGGCEGDVEV